MEKKQLGMVNITHKSFSLRIAVASAIVEVSKKDTIDAITSRKVPKGDVFEFARAAGLLAIKKTSDVIPDCHPLPVEFAGITYTTEGLTIKIRVEVHTIYKTGVEVEAMHGAAITALTMYDMLKPIDAAVQVSQIKLESKSGGKSDFGKGANTVIQCAVIVCSDTLSKGAGADTSGKAVIERLGSLGLQTKTYEIIPDDPAMIQEKVKMLCDDQHQLLVFTGGTGLSHRDQTPDAVLPLIETLIPGIMETARSYGQQRTPFAMLSRGVAGFVRNTLVLTLPGSKKGALETLNAIFPQLLHVFNVRNGERHE